MFHPIAASVALSASKWQCSLGEIHQGLDDKITKLLAILLHLEILTLLWQVEVKSRLLSTLSAL
jgi:hypothetical protein